MKLIALILALVLHAAAFADAVPEIRDPDLLTAIHHLLKVRRERDAGIGFGLRRLYSGSERIKSRYFKLMTQFMDQEPEWQYLMAGRNPNLRQFLIDFDTWLRLYPDDTAAAPELDTHKVQLQP